MDAGNHLLTRISLVGAGGGDPGLFCDAINHVSTTADSLSHVLRLVVANGSCRLKTDPYARIGNTRMYMYI